MEPFGRELSHPRVLYFYLTWHQIMLLVEAVESFSEASQGSSSRKTNMRQKSNMSKLPWKKVAEWMLSHGASYPFAGATCAKKWEQIREMSL